ncbi:MAG: DUF3108 domain-containing protein [Metallibacterium scheffleri]|jgi:hypothetical protein|uniref:DUF3108 domain-containing protein n=1 Tax=Metallibacterium scheffleri TaxID=993689 RepID=UPI0026EC241E|nr:DUF3108 domain-containing protein [Metallibacterium scheffleri]MCK9367770.1 DUF3108 domain-containing protein [Metallibacterium scheffleri]
MHLPKTSPLQLLSLLLALVLPPWAVAAQAAAPMPFSAQYRVLRDGDAIGQATLSLSEARNGEYVFSNVTRGSAGLAALLGLDVSESSRFRWRGDAAQDLGYAYHMQSAFKSITRSTAFDWSNGRITLRDGHAQQHYAAVPGTVDRNLAVLVLALHVAAGARGTVVVPVAMPDRVSRQHYAIATMPVALHVPAGDYQAYAVQRSDADNGLRAWFAPPMLAPVRMEQRDGKGTVYLLELERAPR